jgi:glycerol uptake facilitator-like aquaporin
MTPAMNISGGHINPAVTIGLMAISISRPLWRYIVAQLLGQCWASTR